MREYSIQTHSERDRYGDPVRLYSFRDAGMAWETWRAMLPDLPPRTTMTRWDGYSTLTMAVKLGGIMSTATMTGEQRMLHFGTHAGNRHAAEGMPMETTERLTEWAEAHRKQACRNCPNDDACAEWQNHGACPANLRRIFKRAYRIAYENRVETA